MNRGSLSVRTRKIIKLPFFSKNYGNHYVFCDSAELKKMITMWTEQIGGHFEDFSKVLKLIGVPTPVKLVEFNKEDNSFNCIFHKESLKIFLHLRSGKNNYSDIWISKGNDIYKYRVEFLPRLNAKLVIREIKQNGKILFCYYLECFYHLHLIFDDIHTLKVTIQQTIVDNQKSQRTEPFILKNHEEIEDYVLGLDACICISEVHKSLVDFLNFSDEDICYGDNILIVST